MITSILCIPARKDIITKPKGFLIILLKAKFSQKWKIASIYSASPKYILMFFKKKKKGDFYLDKMFVQFSSRKQNLEAMDDIEIQKWLKKIKIQKKLVSQSMFLPFIHYTSLLKPFDFVWGTDFKLFRLLLTEGLGWYMHDSQLNATHQFMQKWQWYLRTTTKEDFQWIATWILASFLIQNWSSMASEVAWTIFVVLTWCFFKTDRNGPLKTLC